MPRPKLRPLQHPSRIEARYRRALHGYVKDMRIDPRVLLSDPRWRQDGFTEDTLAVIETLRNRFRGVWSESRIRRMVQDILERVSAWNARQFNSQWGSTIGYVGGGGAEQREIEAAFVAQNVDLIKSIDARYFDEIERMVLDAIRTGGRVEGLRDGIKARYGVSKSRASLIARDQVGKLQGQLTRQRQLDVGVLQASWSSSKDERVRRSHRKADGKVFDLDEGLLVDGVRTWPGQPVRCRCSSIPVIPEFDADV